MNTPSGPNDSNTVSPSRITAPSAWIDANPFRAHVDFLVRATGCEPLILAAAMEIHPAAMMLLVGTRDSHSREVTLIATALGERIMSQSPATINTWLHELVHAGQTRNHLRALLNMGYSRRQLSRTCRIFRDDLDLVLACRKSRCDRITSLLALSEYRSTRYGKAPYRIA